MIKEYRMKKLFLVSLVGLVLVGGAVTYRYVGDHTSEELLAQPGESVLQKTGLKVAEILKRAESGDAVMQYNLGQMFSEGEGVQKNEKTASSWLIRAAEQGLDQAQAAIGARYLVGVGVSTDWNEGMSWLEKASMQEHPIAQMVLGALYLGQGPKAPPKFIVNYDRAFHWMLKSARNGFAAAQEVVSRMYADGIGTKADDKEAWTWLIKAAEGGSEAAMKNIATACEQGSLGFGKDLSEAGKWCERSNR